MRILAFIFVCASMVGGCGDSSTKADMAIVVGPDMELFSACGHPGDTGNSKNIGQYCDNNTPCPGSLLCSNLENGSLPANQQVYFCTTTCPTAGPDLTICGENATCACKSAGCACVPNVCLTAGMSG